jgi:hypothetical protein
VTGFGDLRGMAYDPNAGHLFVSDATGVIRELTLEGATVQKFSIPSVGFLNALAFDPTTDTLWLALFDEGINTVRAQARCLARLVSWTGSPD